MSSPHPKTPSPPPPPANPTNTPMPPPPSPSPSMTATPRTPSRRTPLESPVPRTPRGSVLACSSDSDAMTVVKVHTAKCTECDKRNKDTMLRCPGCTFQICRPCRQRREKNGRDLIHGAMMSPGGLGSGLGSGPGVVRRKVVGKMGASPSPSPAPAKDADDDEDMEDVPVEPKGKAKKTLAGKKRALKSKPAVSDESDDDDDFRPDLASPTASKKHRTTLAITDTPTATSARPSRTAPQTSAYVAQHSPSPSSSGGDLLESSSQRPVSLERQDAAPTGRLQELLEANGVNTPGNRYAQHFLNRHDFVVTNPVTSIPETVRRMAEPKPRLTAEQKVDLRNKAHLRGAAKQAQVLAVRDVVNMETGKYQTGELSADENDELASAIKETARKWAMRTYDALPRGVQATVARNLDLRLDLVQEGLKVQLAKAIEGCALRKLNEFEQDRATSPSAGA